MKHRVYLLLTFIATIILFLGIPYAQELPDPYAKLSPEEAIKFAKKCDVAVQNLQKKGDLQNAIQYAWIALKLREKHLPPESLEIATTANFLAILLYSKGDYAKAEPLYQQALAIREKALGKEHPDVVQSLNNLAVLLYAKGEYERSEPLFRQALAIREKVLEKEHPDVAQSLNNLASLLDAKGDYAEAEPLYRQALVIYEKVLGKGHRNVAKILNNLAMLLQAKGDYEGAEPLHRQALVIYEKVLEKEHPDVADSLNNLAMLLKAKGDYEGAEPLFRQALVIYEKVLGKEHKSTATSLDNLAILLNAKGDYEGAEPLYRQALSIREKVLGKEHPDVAGSLNNLAMLLKAKGDYEGAELFFRQALALSEKALGKEHSHVAASLNNLASLLHVKGDYEGSEPLYRQALAIREKVLGKEHPDVAGSLNNLAMLLQAKWDYEGAEPLFRQALAIFDKVLGKEHSHLARSLNNLAMLLQAKGDYEGAEPLFRQALAIFEKVLGKEHPDVAQSLNDLASLLRAKGNYEGAEPLFRQALAIREKALGKEHPDVAHSLNSLAVLLHVMGRKEEGKRCWIQSFFLLSQHLKKTFSALTEREQELYLNKNVRNQLNLYLSTLQVPELQQEVYGNLLTYRGASATTLRNRNRFAIEPEQRELFDQLKQARTVYSNGYLHPNPKLTPETQQKRLDEARTKKETLERKLSENSIEFRKTDQLHHATLQNVMDSLTENEAILDFLFYQHILDWKTGKREECLIVFLITKNAPVQRIDLGKLDYLHSAIRSFRGQLQGGPKHLLANEEEAQTYLVEKLWKPLAKHLEGKDLIYLIPDGDLAFLPFEALSIEIDGKTQYLAELKTISYLFSSLDLYEYQLYPEENGLSLLCLGDVAYSEVPEGNTPLLSSRSGVFGTSKIVWSALPGTKEECNTILTHFQKASAESKTEYLSQRYASKANLIEKSVGKRYVHLATHGYFQEVPRAKFPKKGMNDLQSRGNLILLMDEEEAEKPQPVLLGVSPMFYSGIVLAGANLKSEEKSDGEGYLSAEELAGLNLRGTSLLVLSACETGLGQELSGQGVSGLRLATQVSGAKSMLLSLWKVDDLGTQLFMQRFYEKLWLEKKGKRQALQETKLEWIENQRQRKTGPNGEKIYTTNVWASFILSGQK